MSKPRSQSARHPARRRICQSLRQAVLLAQRELVASLRSPVSLVVIVLFLVIQGCSFWSVLAALADPRGPAPYGAVLRAHFGGTFLYWAFVFFVVSIVAMRLVAEEKRLGTWESLCTAPLGNAALVAGKWLGAVAFYVVLWSPTFAYVVVLAALAPRGVSPDPGPVAAAYLG
ncbi:MAG: ABC transporter permease, partial [Pseudomonadota bacterium]